MLFSGHHLFILLCNLSRWSAALWVMFSAAWIPLKPGSCISDKPHKPKYVCSASIKQNNERKEYIWISLKPHSRKQPCHFLQVTTWVVVSYEISCLNQSNVVLQSLVGNYLPHKWPYYFLVHSRRCARLCIVMVFKLRKDKSFQKGISAHVGKLGICISVVGKYFKLIVTSYKLPWQH